MQFIGKKNKKPVFDYFDDLEIAQEFSVDPFSEQPRSLSHADRRELLREEDCTQHENQSIPEHIEENES